MFLFYLFHFVHQAKGRKKAALIWIAATHGVLEFQPNCVVKPGKIEFICHIFPPEHAPFSRAFPPRHFTRSGCKTGSQDSKKSGTETAKCCPDFETLGVENNLFESLDSLRTDPRELQDVEREYFGDSNKPPPYI